MSANESNFFTLSIGKAMNQNKNTVNQILRAKERHRYGTSHSELLSRIFQLEIAYRHLDRADTELARYFPVAIVACMEGYFKLAIAELIDSSDIYLSNASPLFGNKSKTDFETIKALAGKKLSIGELVAHTISYSSLENIDSALSTVTGAKFLTELKTTHDRWAHEINKEPITPIIKDSNSVYESVKNIFLMRHIVCHELASDYQFNFDQIGLCFKDCLIFLNASKEYLLNLIEPNYPLTQAAMDEKSGIELGATLKELQKLISDISSKLEPRELSQFNAVQDEWASYAEKWTNFDADNYLGGTIRTSIHNMTYKDVVERRIEELRRYKLSRDALNYTE